MAVVKDWVGAAAEEIVALRPDLFQMGTDEHNEAVAVVKEIIIKHCPFKSGTAYHPVRYDPANQSTVRMP